MKLSEVLNKKALKKIGSNAAAGSSNLYKGIKGVFQESNLVHKAEVESADQVLRKEAANIRALQSMAQKNGEPIAAKLADKAFIKMVKQSPYANEIMSYLKGDVKTLSEAARKDLASAMSAVSENGNVLSTTMSAHEQYKTGVDYVNKKVSRNKVPNLATVYYGKPFKEGADLLKNGEVKGNTIAGMKRIGTGAARMAGTVGGVGGSAYAVHALTSDYREDYKENTGSKHF